VKTSRAQLVALADRLKWAVGPRAAKWKLDYDAVNGGWLIVNEVPGGGEERPLGHRRRSAACMADVLEFAVLAVGKV